MKKINLFIGVSEENDSWCSDSCPFLHRSECSMFSETLDDVELPEGHSWNDREPKLVRCDECEKFDQ